MNTSWIQLSFFLPLQGLTIKDNFLFSLSLHGAIYFDLAGSIWYLEFPQERKRLRRRRTLHHLWRDAQAWVSFVTTFFVNWKALLSNASSRRITRLWGTSRPHYTCWRTSRFFFFSLADFTSSRRHTHPSISCMDTWSGETREQRARGDSSVGDGTRTLLSISIMTFDDIFRIVLSRSSGNYQLLDWRKVDHSFHSFRLNLFVLFSSSWDIPKGSHRSGSSVSHAGAGASRHGSSSWIGEDMDTAKTHWHLSKIWQGLVASMTRGLERLLLSRHIKQSQQQEVNLVAFAAHIPLPTVRRALCTLKAAHRLLCAQNATRTRWCARLARRIMPHGNKNVWNIRQRVVKKPLRLLRHLRQRRFWEVQSTTEDPSIKGEADTWRWSGLWPAHDSHPGPCQQDSCSFRSTISSISPVVGSISPLDDISVSQDFDDVWC